MSPLEPLLCELGVVLLINVVDNSTTTVLVRHLNLVFLLVIALLVRSYSIVDLEAQFNCTYSCSQTGTNIIEE